MDEASVRRHYHARFRGAGGRGRSTPSRPAMPRVRSDDYDAKTHAILDSAAALFAKVGYPSAKMQDIAKACGASKSMLYHYFPTKDDLLYAMLEEHLQRVIVALEEALAADPPRRTSASPPSCWPTHRSQRNRGADTSAR
jgi:AcrR family transcriptional regulator